MMNNALPMGIPIPVPSQHPSLSVAERGGNALANNMFLEKKPLLSHFMIHLRQSLEERNSVVGFPEIAKGLWDANSPSGAALMQPCGLSDKACTPHPMDSDNWQELLEKLNETLSQILPPELVPDVQNLLGEGFAPAPSNGLDAVSQEFPDIAAVSAAQSEEEETPNAQEGAELLSLVETEPAGSNSSESAEEATTENNTGCIKDLSSSVFALSIARSNNRVSLPIHRPESGHPGAEPFIRAAMGDQHSVTGAVLSKETSGSAGDNAGQLPLQEEGSFPENAVELSSGKASPREMAIYKIQEILDRIPPKAQEALREVLVFDSGNNELPDDAAAKPWDKPMKELILQNAIEPSKANAASRAVAMDTIQAVLDRVPPEAEEALREVLSKFQTTLLQGTERAKGKSLQQLQFELSLNKPSADPSPALSEHGSSATPASMTDGSGDPQAQITVPPDSNRPVFPMDNARGLSTAADRADENGIKAGAPHEQVVKAAKLSLDSGRTEISIQLKPQDLGQVRLTLHSNAHGEVSARLVTETSHAKESLEKNLSDLIRSLEIDGVKVGKITVVQAGAESRQHQFDQFHQSGSGQQNSHSQSAYSQSQQQNPQHQDNTASDAFTASDSGSFKDGGSFLSEDEASSQVSFDTEVEGEEVLTATEAQENLSVDIRV